MLIEQLLHIVRVLAAKLTPILVGILHVDQFDLVDDRRFFCRHGNWNSVRGLAAKQQSRTRKL